MSKVEKFLVTHYYYLCYRSGSEDIMADEESDKVRRTARDALHTMTGSGKVFILCICGVQYIIYIQMYNVVCIYVSMCIVRVCTCVYARVTCLSYGVANGNNPDSDRVVETRGPLRWSCKPTMRIHHAYTSYNA